MLLLHRSEGVLALVACVLLCLQSSVIPSNLRFQNHWEVITSFTMGMTSTNPAWLLYLHF